MIAKKGTPVRYAFVVLGLLAYMITARAQAQCSILSMQDEARIDALMAKMNVAEKVSQMRIFHANVDARILGGETAITLDAKGKITMPPQVAGRFAAGIAGVKNPGESINPEASAKLTNQLQARIMAASPNGIPALFVGEAYNGLDAVGTTKFSRPIAMASTWNPDLVAKAWDVIGREARLRGLHMLHSPVADIHRDPRFGRMSEGYGEDSFLTTAMVIAAVRGVQGQEVGLKSTHVGAVTKHFVGYGQVDGGRNFASVNVNPRDLIDQYFPPFKAAVQQGCTLGIMPSHGDINGVASHGNRWLLTDVLRKNWGFEGYIVSDAEDVARLGFFMGVAADDKAAALAGLNAGVDVDLYSERAYAHLPDLAAKDQTILPAINDAARRVLSIKMKLGLFDKPFVDPKAAANGVRTQEAQTLSAKLDLEAVILLKNEGGFMPLTQRAARTVALIGPMIGKETQDRFAEVGIGTSFITEPALQLTDRDIASPTLLSAEKNTVGIARAVQAAKLSDIAILFLGDDEFTAKEAFFRDGVKGDRASLDLAGQQDELFSAVKAIGKPVIVVVKARRTLSISTIAKEADAIYYMWEPGEFGDRALAMLIAGRENPSGRLPVTIPRHVGQLPVHYSQKRINFKKGYLFEEEGPLYPFGYGLSYTSFAYEGLSLSAPIMRPGAPIIATVKIRNTGKRAGKEVVQLYISDPIASVTRPVKELKAFYKVSLEPGEVKEVAFTITPAMLIHTGADMQPDPGYGAFTIEAGPSSGGGGLIAEAAFNEL